MKWLMAVRFGAPIPPLGEEEGAFRGIPHLAYPDEQGHWRGSWWVVGAIPLHYDELVCRFDGREEARTWMLERPEDYLDLGEIDDAEPEENHFPMG